MCPAISKLSAIQTVRNTKLGFLQSASDLYRLETATSRRNLVPIFADRGVSRGQLGGSLTVVNLRFLDRSRYLFLSSSSSFILTRLSGPHSRPSDSQKTW
jgi:hypothetical protein